MARQTASVIVMAVVFFNIYGHLYGCFAACLSLMLKRYHAEILNTGGQIPVVYSAKADSSEKVYNQ